MEPNAKAFTEKIPEGLVRILLHIESVVCEVENDAPDFVDPLEDHPSLKVTPEVEVGHLTDAFTKTYSLELDTRKTKNGILVWKPKKGIWFDIEMDEVKQIWLSNFDFYIESEKPRYLKYFIQDVHHKIQWLQVNKNTGEIQSLSEFRKEFIPPKVSGKSTFNGSEVLKCADMLGRSIKKIDARTQTAMVKFNTEKGRLEPLIIGMAEKLGYKIESLDKETINRESEKGNSVSHIISLI